MNTARQTDERLRHWLNTDQAARERLCTAILPLLGVYTDVRPRRPEGGPDGGRDIECRRGQDVCFGAVGFVNDASDSPEQLRSIKDKFHADVDAALKAQLGLKAFVFFTNIDLAPATVSELQQYANRKGLSFVDVCYRERLRQVLDSVDGLAFRYQYMGLPLSDAEQASFFARFGKDLEAVIVGKLDRIERKLEELEFARWRAGAIRRLGLEIKFKAPEESKRNEPEHFRVCLELQSVGSEHRGIIIGGRDDYWKAGDNKWYFGTSSFFHRQRFGSIEKSWVPASAQVRGGVTNGIEIDIRWVPVSDILALEFDGLTLHFHYTENLLQRISQVRFTIDSYVFLSGELRFGADDRCRPSLGWPDELTAEELMEPWRLSSFGWLRLDRLPIREGSLAW